MVLKKAICKDCPEIPLRDPLDPWAQNPAHCQLIFLSALYGRAAIGHIYGLVNTQKGLDG